jgi:hypothetical protein
MQFKVIHVKGFHTRINVNGEMVRHHAQKGEIVEGSEGFAQKFKGILEPYTPPVESPAPSSQPEPVVEVKLEAAPAVAAPEAKPEVKAGPAPAAPEPAAPAAPAKAAKAAPAPAKK